MRRRALLLAGAALALAGAAAPIPLHLHCPAAWRPGGKLVAVLHGLRRNAAGYRDAWAPQAALGVTFGWRLLTAQGVGHSSGRMAAAAAELLV